MSQTEVAQIASQYQQALAAIPAIAQQVAAQENLISVLQGRDPGPVARGKTIEQLVPPLIPADLPVGVAATPARHPAGRAEPRRRQCQHRCCARALLPDDFAHRPPGHRKHGVRRLPLRSGQRVGTCGRRHRADFHVRRHRGQVLSAEAQQRQALAFYQQTILVAFRETNDALTGSQTKIEEVAMQQLRVQALRDFARLSRLKFDKGAASYLEVLVAENELFAAELTSARVLAERYTQLVNVYQAMGGGWVDIANSVNPRPAGLAANLWPLR